MIPADNQRFEDLTALREPFHWSGQGPVPTLGEDVHVTMNGLGPGLVRGYFLDHGRRDEPRFLGVVVELLRPPAHWQQQVQRQLQEGKRQDDLVHVFGTEIRMPEPPPLGVRVTTEDGRTLDLVLNAQGQLVFTEETKGYFRASSAVSRDQLAAVLAVQRVRQKLASADDGLLKACVNRDTTVTLILNGTRLVRLPALQDLYEVLAIHPHADIAPERLDSDQQGDTLDLPVRSAREHLETHLADLELTALGHGLVWPHSEAFTRLSPETQAAVAPLLTAGAQRASTLRQHLRSAGGG